MGFDSIASIPVGGLSYSKVCRALGTLSTCCAEGASSASHAPNNEYSRHLCHIDCICGYSRMKNDFGGLGGREILQAEGPHIWSFRRSHVLTALSQSITDDIRLLSSYRSLSSQKQRTLSSSAYHA